VDPQQHKASTLAAYERLADVWDDTDDNLWNEALERTTVRRLLPRPLFGQRVLDAGCASGAHAAWLCAQGCQVSAFDLSPGMVRQARARLSGAAQFAVADLAAPPFADGVFDGILCSLALHYLSDAAPTLRHFARMLRPSGWLLLTLDHPFGPMPVDVQRDYFAERLVTDTWEKKGVEVTQHFWRRPLGSVVDDLAEAGFVILRIAETQLDDEMRRRFPEDAAKIEGRPSFIAYLARLGHAD
jgi:SAM-dependent methyltransferase